MKTYILFITSLILSIFTANATTKSNEINTNTTAKVHFGSYGDSFIFNVDGVEFSIFKDGQFDFNLLSNNTQLRVNVNNSHSNISFNSGFNYNAFVQYDEFGAIIQIENIPVYYDYFGRINQAGNIIIQYNNYGFINRIGGLNIFYRNHSFSHHTGFINTLNRGYVTRPWHRYYSIPTRNFCVVYNRPYRQFYNPVRYTYNRRFQNNYRPRTAIANRRGNSINRNRTYATANRSNRNVTQINRTSRSRINTTNKNAIVRRGYLRNGNSFANTNLKRQKNSNKYNRINRNSKRVNNSTRQIRQSTTRNTRANSIKRKQTPSGFNNTLRTSNRTRARS